MVGELEYRSDLIGKTIPYKYVVCLQNGEELWEWVHHPSGNGEHANRCLVVPNVENMFVKYDDVVLRDRTENITHQFDRGRNLAVQCMLPQPLAISQNPDLNFSSVLALFEQVITAHSNKKICYGEYSQQISSGVTIKNDIRCNYQGLVDMLRGFVATSECDPAAILRLTVYICLLRNLKSDVIEMDPGDVFVFFKAFHLCSVMLVNGGVPSKIGDDFQYEIAQALKRLVNDFIGAKHKYSRDDVGDWLFAIPFIHCWDNPNTEDMEWLMNIEKWKSDFGNLG